MVSFICGTWLRRVLFGTNGRQMLHKLDQRPPKTGSFGTYWEGVFVKVNLCHIPSCQVALLFF